MPSASPIEVDSIRVHVLLFSVLKELVGRSTVELQLEAHARPRDVLAQLADRFPPVKDYRSVIRIAVNHAYVNDEVELSDGDELALITPVSGG